jgi:Zn-dependent protease/CBS domain-containing protein
VAATRTRALLPQAGTLTRPYTMLYQLLRSRDAALPTATGWRSPDAAVRDRPGAGGAGWPGSTGDGTDWGAGRGRGRGDIPLARIWGVPVSLDWSWLLILALMTWSLAQGFFPAEHPGLQTQAYWLMAAATAVLFCASVLAHELAHTRAALKAGLRVRGIKLYLLGGAAELTQEPRTPADEFRIAAVGPLTSLLFAASFNLVVQAGAPAYLVGPAEWLARTNLMLALFNLIPGFPLDGGRILRAAVWKWTGSLSRSTAIAAGTGQLAAMAVMGWGVFSLVGGGVLSGVWLLLIGWFMQQAAAATYLHTAVREALRGVTVARVMSRERPVVDRHTSLHDLVEDRILGRGERCFFVLGAGHDVLGVLTMRDVTAIPRERWPGLTVADVMRPQHEVVKVDARTELLEALQLMDDAGVAQVPVVDGDAVEGVLTREQVLHYIRVRAELGL